ncbi:hypothetical protein [Oleiharenicola lentus]|uniref:hypothetical protein n=1 Tax=Oleiharenicola lentus TaxID=2508720 RepID=UPI003F67777E
MKRFLLSCVVLISAATALRAVEVDALIKEAQVAETKLDSRRALELLQQADAAQPNNALILQKIAKQYSDLVLEQKTVAEKKRYAQTALEYSQRAVELDPRDPVSVLSLAVCHGKLAVYSDTQTKIKYSRLVKEEAERAIALKPDYAWAHHLLGRWHYEVATLGGGTRFAVKLFYGGLPDASVATAIAELKHATELEPTELNHWLELGFAYKAAGDLSAARENWNRGLSMSSRGKHDESAKIRAREALGLLK